MVPVGRGRGVVWWCCCRLLGCGCGFVVCRAGACAPPTLLGRPVLVRAPLHGGACCVYVCPPPWWGVLRWFVAPLMVGRAVRVRGPPLSGACYVGVCPPPLVGRAALVCGPPSWWGVLCWCLAPLSVGRAVSVPARRGGGVWFGGVWLGLSSSVGWVVVAVVLVAWPALVLC